MPKTPVKFGILSTATIANVIVKAIKGIPEAECVAIASRDMTRAKAFAEKYGIREACLYNDLLTLPIDAVYIPLPTSMAADWAVLCAKAGKHVLVDKPLGSTRAVRDIIEACENAGVVFLDGTHFVHSARTKEVLRRISAGDIGSIRRIDAAFSFPKSRVAENIRSDPNLEPQGYLGDIGWYCFRAAVLYLGAEVTSRVLSVTCVANFHPKITGLVQRGSGIVQFGTKHNSVNLCFSFDSSCALQQRVAIIGDMGTIETLDFVEPPGHSAMFEDMRRPEDFTTDTEYTYDRAIHHIDNDEVEMFFPCRDHVLVKEPGNLTQPQTMIQEFCRLILDDDKTRAKSWAREALATQGILDAIMANVKG